MTPQATHEMEFGTTKTLAASRKPAAKGGGQTALNRRLFLALGVALGPGLAGYSGCATPLFRGQSPDLETSTEQEKKTELVGDFARPVGLNWMKLESIALVTNLDNTGSDPPPSEQRQVLLAEMQSHEVRQADKILADPSTSMVFVRTYLPPGVQKGDALDVEVRVPMRSETTSLRRGWLLRSRLRQMEVVGGQSLRGNIEGLAEGDVLVDAIFEGSTDKVLETRGRVLGGGASLITRELGLALSKNDASIRTSTLIGKAINQRFFMIDAGVKKGVANPERDDYLSLTIAPRYKHNLARYLRVIRNIPLRENPVERVERLQLLEKKLLEPTSSALASLQLEAIGAEAISALKNGLRSSEPEIRFYAAEALAYLDQPEAAAPLAEAAKKESAFRWHALTALSTMTHVAALDGLSDLLHVPSVETRYGAFRAMRTRNAGDPTTRGEWLNKKFSYHVIPTTGEPLIHISRSRQPEIVVFGHEQKLKNVKQLYAGKRILIMPMENGDLRAGRYDPGQDTVYESFPAELDKLIRAIVKLGGGYAEVIQCLQEAKKGGCLEGRLAVEAMPRPDRKFYRDDDPLPDSPEGEDADSAETAPSETTLADRRVTTPSPELFRDNLRGPQAELADKNESKAIPGGTYIDPEYIPKKPTVLDKLNPFPKKAASE
jgi:flagellar basal body P-ring protein FlgI